MLITATYSEEEENETTSTKQLLSISTLNCPEILPDMTSPTVQFSHEHSITTVP
jgi:hypothetical protein